MKRTEALNLLRLSGTVAPGAKIKKKRYMPTHVFINGFQAEGLDRHSIALCEQLCCVRYGDLMRQVGKVSTFQMLKITLGMQIQLGMVGKYNE